MDALQSLPSQFYHEGSEGLPNPQKIEEEGLLPLDLPERVVQFTVKETGTPRRHIFRRVTRADADAYYSARTASTEHKTKDSTDHEVDLLSPALKLYDRIVKRVEGYPMWTDGREFMAIDGWKNKVPGLHRYLAIEKLVKAVPSKSCPDAAVDPDADVVSLDAYWSADAPGMRLFTGLRHRFNTPTISHWRKLSNKGSRTTAIRGSQSQRTIYALVHDTHIELYDELIVSVGDYSVSGLRLSSREQCVSQMDPFHKIAAVKALFESSRDGELEGAEEL